VSGIAGQWAAVAVEREAWEREGGRAERAPAGRAASAEQRAAVADQPAGCEQVHGGVATGDDDERGAGEREREAVGEETARGSSWQEHEGGCHVSVVAAAAVVAAVGVVAVAVAVLAAAEEEQREDAGVAGELVGVGVDEMEEGVGVYALWYQRNSSSRQSSPW
jgi:hypothetical protein